MYFWRKMSFNIQQNQNYCSFWNIGKTERGVAARTLSKLICYFWFLGTRMVKRNDNKKQKEVQLLYFQINFKRMIYTVFELFLKNWETRKKQLWRTFEKQRYFMYVEDWIFYKVNDLSKILKIPHFLRFRSKEIKKRNPKIYLEGF